MAEERVCRIEDRSIEIMQSKEQREEWRKINSTLENCGALKHTNICIMREPEGEKKEQKKYLNK